MEIATVNTMSIRAKLISLFILLLALLLTMQGILYYQYTNKVSEHIGEAAFEVSKETASLFIYNQDSFYTNDGYTIDESGKSSQKIIVKPIHKNIEIRLGDELNDEVIRVISDSNEFQIPIPRTQINNSINQLQSLNFWLTFGLFAVAILLIAYLTYNITKPLLALNKTAEKIGQGELGAQIEIDNKKYGSDVNSMINQFNKMSSDLVRLNQQKEQSKELEHFRELSDISRGLAHNLRNPLNTLQLSLEQLQDDNESIQQSQKTSIALNQVSRIEKWLRDFTLLMEQGINKENCSLKKIILGVLDNYPSTKFNFDTKEDVSLHCVETELSMIVQIIVQNAIDATKDLQHAEVTIDYSQTKEWITLKISDFGQGINEDIKSNLFKPYVTNKTYGSGMGLFIAQRLLQHRYNAEIQFSDNIPAGTVASISLPTRIKDV